MPMSVWHIGKPQTCCSSWATQEAQKRWCPHGTKKQVMRCAAAPDTPRVSPATAVHWQWQLTEAGRCHCGLRRSPLRLNLPYHLRGQRVHPHCDSLLCHAALQVFNNACSKHSLKQLICASVHETTAFRYCSIFHFLNVTVESARSDTDVCASSCFYSHDLITYCPICPDVWSLLVLDGNSSRADR